MGIKQTGPNRPMRFEAVVDLFICQTLLLPREIWIKQLRLRSNTNTNEA